MRRHASMRGIAVALATLGVLAATPRGHGSDAAPLVVGAAYGLDSQSLLYTETHCGTDDALVRDVIYRNTDNRLLARKTLDYQTGIVTPSFVQHNLYAGDSIAVAMRQDQLHMTVTDGTGTAKTVTARVDPRMPLVIDAGFDAFVREHWAALVAGQSKRFQFPFAGRDNLVNLRISPAQCTYDTPMQQCFLLELDNWALRLLVDPIELGYDPRHKRLERYRGLSNIGDGKGEGQVVDIRYRYEGLPEGGCDTPA